MYELVETAGEWVVRKSGLEVGRYDAEAAALQAMAEHIRRDSGGDPAVAFAMRFNSRLS